ncbi:MAG: class I SAM-dependent methyltransferase, partial [Anaerolineales bacterium]|nr:class I SAM-dependent methyltransferase [Anaerolineales bacterium]
KDFYDCAVTWWGADPQAEGVHAARAKTIERLCGAGTKTILELGAGPGATAATLADLGHAVVAIELSPQRAQYARELAKIPRAGSLTILEADFYTVALDARFDIVCIWETFGLGSDADQRRLLTRIAREWLAPGGSALVEVYNPIRPARDAGTEERLAPLKGVPSSVEMFERCHFDPVRCRWIDEWVPTAAPEHALAQTIRCYTPADLLLLLEGTGLGPQHIEVDGEVIDARADKIATGGALMQAWCYLAQLVAE